MYDDIKLNVWMKEYLPTSLFSCDITHASERYRDGLKLVGNFSTENVPKSTIVWRAQNRTSLY